MAPRKTKLVILKTESMKKKLKVKQVKAEMGMMKQEQECIREEQKRLRLKCGEIEKECDQLKMETEILMKQTVGTQIKMALIFKILKAREAGDLTQVATLTQFLREFVAGEGANATSESDDEDEN